MGFREKKCQHKQNFRLGISNTNIWKYLQAKCKWCAHYRYVQYRVCAEQWLYGCILSLQPFKVGPVMNPSEYIRKLRFRVIQSSSKILQAVLGKTTPCSEQLSWNLENHVCLIVNAGKSMQEKVHLGHKSFHIWALFFFLMKSPEMSTFGGFVQLVCSKLVFL